MDRWHLSCSGAAWMALLLVVVATFAAEDRPALRNWTDASGRHQTRARFVDLEDGRVRLQKEDGTEVKVPLSALAAKDQEYVAEVARSPSERQASQWKSFRHRASGVQQVGRILQRASVVAGRKIYVEDRTTGLKRWLWEHEWEIGELADSETDPPASPPLAAPPATSSIPITLPLATGSTEPALSTPSDPSSAASAPASLVSQVLVVGSGADFSDAEKSALAHAIERAVGTMVDGVTVVENDELMKHEILTYTRGYIHGYDVLRRWEENGTVNVEIAARVSLTKLGAKLKASSASEQAVNGHLMQVQIELEKQYERNACEMFRNAVAEFTPPTMLTLGVLDQSEMERTDSGAKLTVRYTATANLAAWEQVRLGITPLLQQICIARTSVQAQRSQYGANFVYVDRLPSKPNRWENCHSYVYRNRSPEGGVSYFDGYALPVWMEPEISGLAARHALYQIRVVLLDADNGVVADARASRPALVVRFNTLEDEYRSSSMAPLPYASTGYVDKWESSHVFHLKVDELGRVAKCVATWVCDSAQ